MPPSKADIITRLQQEILSLQGYKSTAGNSDIDTGLGEINHSFPNHTFPTGAIHEFVCNDTEGVAATTGFLSGILSSLMKSGGASLWIGSSRKLFPPALKSFGIDPEKIIFVDIKKETDVLWATEEALKCDGLAAVVGEMPELSFNASRRFQLAVEQSHVTGFVIRRNPRNLTTASVTRWKITSLPSVSEEDLPGVGFSRWNVELLRVRNGHPGTWAVGWSAGRFQLIAKLAPIVFGQQRKTG